MDDWRLMGCAIHHLFFLSSSSQPHHYTTLAAHVLPYRAVEIIYNSSRDLGVREQARADACVCVGGESDREASGRGSHHVKERTTTCNETTCNGGPGRAGPAE